MSSTLPASDQSQPPGGRPNAGAGSDPFAPSRALLLELLGDLDQAARGSPRALFDRICQGVCDLTGLTRCALLLYDEREKRVLPAGSHGIPEEIVEVLHGTLEETPIAARALAEDRVIITDELEREIPERHRDLPGVETLACVPVAAGESWLGVMLCDRGGGPFDLDASHLDLMWTLGKAAALVAGTRLATTQHEQARLLAERVAFAREVHDRVMQRLFGLSLALGSEEPLGPTEQRRAGEEIQSALEDLRAAMQRSRGPAKPPPSPTLAEEVERLRSHYPSLELRVAGDHHSPPAGLEALAQSVLAEGLHNAAKHAAGCRVEIATERGDGAFALEIRNDGAGDGHRPGSGMGLRLAAFEALGAGGVLEFGPAPPDGWRVRLVLPLEEGEGAGR